MACHSLDIPFLKTIFWLWRHLFFLILQTSYKRVRPCRSSCLYSRYTKHWFYQFFLIRLWDLNLLFRNMKWKLKLCLGKFLCSIYLYRYKDVANEPWRNSHYSLEKTLIKLLLHSFSKYGQITDVIQTTGKC